MVKNTNCALAKFLKLEANAYIVVLRKHGLI
mgnify:CR=1 FL=1